MIDETNEQNMLEPSAAARAEADEALAAFEAAKEEHQRLADAAAEALRLDTALRTTRTAEPKPLFRSEAVKLGAQIAEYEARGRVVLAERRYNRAVQRLEVEADPDARACCIARILPHLRRLLALRDGIRERHEAWSQRVVDVEDEDLEGALREGAMLHQLKDECVREFHATCESGAKASLRLRRKRDAEGLPPPPRFPGTARKSITGWLNELEEDLRLIEAEHDETSPFEQQIRRLRSKERQALASFEELTREEEEAKARAAEEYERSKRREARREAIWTNPPGEKARLQKARLEREKKLAEAARERLT